MAPEVSVNATINIRPCYEIEKVSQLVIRKLSTICVLFYLFVGLLSIVTVCGNLLVITAIIYFKQLHTPTNSLILSLAVADLLVGVVVFPLSMEVTTATCWYNFNDLCEVRDNFDIILSTASILNLCCISIDRYYAVCKPLTYGTAKTNVYAVIMILVSWTGGILVGIGFVIAGLNYKKCEDGCFIDVLLASTLGPFLAFYLPVIVMLCFYLKIFRVAQRQARSIQSTKSGAAVSKMERKATKTLATVMGVFLICWLPIFLCIAIHVFFVEMPVTVFETLDGIAQINSILNPFIYAFFYSWFRTAFKMILSGKIFKGDFTNAKLF